MSKRKYSHFVWDKGKIVSKHTTFYLAQCAVEKHLEENKISNYYEIIDRETLKMWIAQIIKDLPFSNCEENRQIRLRSLRDRYDQLKLISEL